MKKIVKHKVLEFCYVTDFVANGSFASLRENVSYINSPDYAVLVRLTDFTKKWSKNFIYVSKASYEFLKKSSLDKGDLIMSNVGEPGIVFLVPDLSQPMTLGPNSILIRPNENSSTSKFLYYYFLSEKGKKQIDEISTGAAQKKFNKTAFRDLEIPLPPLSEQQRIEAILDEAFDTIAKAKANSEQNLKNAKELFESYLQNVFENKGEDWEKKALENLVDEKCTLSYGIVQPGEEYANGLPVIRPTDLTSKFITIKGLKLIDPKLAEGYKRTKLIGDELLLCVRGSTGIVSIASKELAGANVTRGIVPIRFNSKIINQEYGYYLLVSNYIQAQIKAKTYGAALMQINIGDLRKILTPYPSLKIQKALVQKLDALSAETKKLEATYQKKLEDLEELKKSILQKAFSGELTEKEVLV